MERLTRKEAGEVLIKDGWSRSDTSNYTSLCYGCSEFYICKNRCGFYKALERLAEYEDTGLPPEQIKSFLTDFGITVVRKNIELRKDCDYWKREALKWANEIGEQRIGPLLWMDEERVRREKYLS